MKRNHLKNSQYQAVRQLIKQNWQPTLDEIKHIYNLFGFKELPYQVKSSRTGDVRYYDPTLAHGTRVHYVLNARKGEMRKRNYRYGGPVNPRPGQRRDLLTAPFVNNLPKQMLFVLSTLIAERLNNNGQIPIVFPPELPRPKSLMGHPLPKHTQLLISAMDTNGMFGGPVNRNPIVFQPVTPTIPKRATATLSNVKQSGKEITLQITITLP